MFVFYGVLCLSLSFLVSVIVLLGCRNPKPHKWVGDFWTFNVLTPTIVGLLAFGIGILVKYAANIGEKRVDALELGLLAGVVMLTYGIYRMLRVKERLARYAAQSEAQVINLADAKQTPVSPAPETSAPAGTDRRAA